ncbi:hypothetical protein [Bacillus cereus]|uniref:hypothetical protein n=1 Tax=Bacillus cereus TaxID=1396 RepID=UPI000995128B|nr:hypothetical protein [Bacillus cereus]OPA04766.1 hypothetical protein BHL31_27920 [Bacillus cereus]HDR7762366.1 hypothetical protein [Bacillus cereus]
MFEELFYPENADRKRRVEELMVDCGTYSAQLVKDKEAIDLLLKNADEVIKEAYKNMGKGTVPYEKVTLAPKWVVELPKSISMVGVFGGTTKVFEKMAVAYLLKQGRIGEAAFTQLVGLPRWFQVGKFFSGVVVVIALESVISAITGAVVREKLREGTKSLIPPRIDLKHTQLHNDNIKITLSAVIAAVDAVKAMALTPEQLNAGIHNIIENKKQQNNSITRKFAIQKLDELDKGRGSYTKEDPSVEAYYTALAGIEAMGVSVDDVDLDISQFYSYN